MDRALDYESRGREFESSLVRQILLRDIARKKMKIQNISAIVTGGASGLGEASARALAAKGARVTLFDMNEERGPQVAQEIGGRFARVDVSSESDVKNALDEAADAHGPVRMLVNCAGIAIGAKTVGRGEPHPLDAFEKVLKVNLVGTFNCIRLAAAVMAAFEPLQGGERGAIVCTASVAAFEGQIGQVAYAASKAGVAGMTLPIARDLAGSGIRINTIAPGLFKTPMLASLPQEVQDALGASVPYPHRLGDPSEYAKLVVHLIENQYCNGETIRLDGALRMAPK